MLYNQRFKPQKLKKYAKVQGGYAFKSSEYTGSGIPIVRIGDLKSNTVDIENCVKVSNSYLDTCKNFIIKDNELLIAMTGATVGKVAFVKNFKTHLLLNQRVGRFICDSTKIDSKYLYYVTSAQEFYNEVQILATGAGQPNISPMQIENINIPVPDSIEEQQEIVQVLDTMSDIIRLREECISHAQDLIPALFQEMFGNPLTNDKNLPIVRIDTVTKVVSGGTPSTQNSEYWDGDIIWLTPKDLSGYNSMYISKGKRNITDLGYKKSSAQMMPKGSVLFTSRAPIGYVAIADTDLCTNQGFKSFIPTEAIKSEYLYQLLKMSKEKIINISSGATFKEISGGRIKELKIPLPPIELQEQFAQKVIEIESYIEEQQDELENARQMFQSLLHHAFTGELTRRAYGKD